MDIQMELNKVWKECSDIIEVRNRRAAQLVELLEAKDVALISTIKESSDLLDSFDLELKQGFKQIFLQLSEEILGIYHDSRRQVMESGKHRSVQFTEHLADRKRFETEEVVQNLVAHEQQSIQEELDLIDSCKKIETQEQSKLRQSVRDVEAEIEITKGNQLKNAHVVEFGTELLKYKLDQDKLELRKTKREAIKLHSIRNEMRESVRQAESVTKAADRKNENELQRLRSSKASLTQKLSELEKINAKKYSRILKSNEEEIRFLSDQLMESMNNLVRSISSGDYASQESRHPLPENISEDERWRSLSEPIPAADVEELKIIVALLEEQLQLRQRQHELADKLHAKCNETYNH